MTYAGRFASYPAAGALRVSAAPAELFRTPDPGSARPPLHRFDDPHGDFGVRYFATTLRGALIEVLDQFRAVPHADQLLATVAHVDDIDILAEESAGRVPERWLADRRVGTGILPEPVAHRFLDLMDEDLLGELTLRPSIEQVLLAHPEAFGDHPRLDFGSLQSSGVAARKLTQAVAREVHDLPSAPVGIRYISRHTEDEECWAVFDDRARVLFEPYSSFLDALEREHAEALRSAARLHRLHVPPIWS